MKRIKKWLLVTATPVIILFLVLVVYTSWRTKNWNFEGHFLRFMDSFCEKIGLLGDAKAPHLDTNLGEKTDRLDSGASQLSKGAKEDELGKQGFKSHDDENLLERARKAVRRIENVHNNNN